MDYLRTLKASLDNGIPNQHLIQHVESLMDSAKNISNNFSAGFIYNYLDELKKEEYLEYKDKIAYDREMVEFLGDDAPTRIIKNLESIDKMIHPKWMHREYMDYHNLRDQIEELYGNEQSS